VLRDFVTQSKLLSGMLYDLHKMDDLNNCRVQTQYCKIFCTIVGFVPKLSNNPSHSHDTCVRWFNVSADLREDIFYSYGGSCHKTDGHMILEFCRIRLALRYFVIRYWIVPLKDSYELLQVPSSKICGHRCLHMPQSPLCLL
jgi:hypothetical protein